MKAPRLEFAAADRDPARAFFGQRGSRLAWLGMALLPAALACTGVIAWHAWQLEAELTEVRLALQASQRRAGQRTAAADAAMPLLSPQQRQGWNQVARQLNTPWPALLDALESGTPEGIALVAIEPDTRQGSVRLQAEAKTLDALLAYAGQLAGSGPFGSVAFIKHETNEQDSNRPLRLTLDVLFRARAAEASR